MPPIIEGRKAYAKDDLSYFIDDEMSEIIDIRDYSEGFLGRVLWDKCRLINTRQVNAIYFL